MDKTRGPLTMLLTSRKFRLVVALIVLLVAYPLAYGPFLYLCYSPGPTPVAILSAGVCFFYPMCLLPSELVARGPYYDYLCWWGNLAVPGMCPSSPSPPTPSAPSQPGSSPHEDSRPADDVDDVPEFPRADVIHPPALAGWKPGLLHATLADLRESFDPLNLRLTRFSGR
ncbi:MAG: hypothetical protein ACT4QC_05205 [Planctomycetaceae bacterium]